jgi:prevent-host-death family protein
MGETLGDADFQASLTRTTRPTDLSSPQSGSTSSQEAEITPRCINVQEAKTHLSALLARVAAGERIVLARHGKPCAQLVPLDPSPRRELGFLKGQVDDAFFEPLPNDELELWGT